MKLRLTVAALATALMLNAASATSLVKVSEDRIRSHLAELGVTGFHCKDFNLRHNMLDLVWDILELKTGKDPDEESEKELYLTLVDQWEAKFKSDAAGSCNQAYLRYGPDGSALRDAIYRK